MQVGASSAYLLKEKMGFWQMGVLPIAENTLNGSIFEGVNAMKNFLNYRSDTCRSIIGTKCQRDRN